MRQFYRRQWNYTIHVSHLYFGMCAPRGDASSNRCNASGRKKWADGSCHRPNDLRHDERPRGDEGRRHDRSGGRGDGPWRSTLARVVCMKWGSRTDDRKPTPVAAPGKRLVHSTKGACSLLPSLRFDCPVFPARENRRIAPAAGRCPVPIFPPTRSGTQVQKSGARSPSRRVI
jgi:hypothetical protein